MKPSRHGGASSGLGQCHLRNGFADPIDANAIAGPNSRLVARRRHRPEDRPQTRSPAACEKTSLWALPGINRPQIPAESLVGEGHNLVNYKPKNLTKSERSIF